MSGCADGPDGEGRRGATGSAPNGSPAVKICGLGRRGDVEAAVEAGAGYLGLVFAESPRRLTRSRAAGLVENVPARVVGVFVDAPPEEILETAEAVPLDVAQLHGSESPELCGTVRSSGLRVWKALRPRSAAALADGAARYRESVDGLLVEGFSEEAAGGTGTAFPHEWWREAGLDEDRAGEGPALILAGGLTPENVAAALDRTTPRVVDVSSGVETEPGVKDPDRIRAFVRAVREASSGGSAPEPTAAAAGDGTGEDA